MRDWFRRFQHYPGSILGHITWGIGSGIVSTVDPINGAALLSGGYAYQFGSAWRKTRNRQRMIDAGLIPPANTGIDTVGLDSFDYAVGYAIGLGAGYSLRLVL